MKTRMGLLLILVVAMLAVTAIEVNTKDELQNEIDGGATDIVVIGAISIGSTPITIASATNLMIRSGTADAGFEGLGNTGNGLFSIQGGDVTFTGLSFVSGYSSSDGGCMAVVSGATVVFNDAYFASCTAAGEVASTARPQHATSDTFTVCSLLYLILIATTWPQSWNDIRRLRTRRCHMGERQQRIHAQLDSRGVPGNIGRRRVTLWRGCRRND